MYVNVNCKSDLWVPRKSIDQMVRARKSLTSNQRVTAGKRKAIKDGFDINKINYNPKKIVGC